jgi:PAS domain S-box-containing protein
LKELLDSNSNCFTIEWNGNECFCSRSFEDFIGYTSKELSQLPFGHHSIISENQGEEIRKSLIEAKSDEFTEQKKIDFELVSKDGKNIWMREFIKFPGKENNNNFISILFDISDFKNYELELNETINVKTKLNNAKDKLLSIISHDLRAPFSSLLGFAEILINEPNLPEEERNEFLQYIFEASQIQLQMVNHLLDWTRLQSGAMKFDPQRLDIKDVVDNCVSVLTGSVIRKNIQIKVVGQNGIFVSADERLISQAITNLLSNAVKFTPSGKKITVTIDNFKESMIELVISDEGVGIEEKYHDKLFRIDAKFTKIGTAGEKGSGFGLPLVKEIIEKHNGDIWFYSEYNKGSDFHFTLPKSDDTILILEEHEDLQNVYLHLVEQNYKNYKVNFCKNGFELLNNILENTPSMLITYHKMPLMSGLQVVSSLRKKDIHSKVDVIVLGDNISENEKKEYKNYNVKTFLKLNSTPDQLDAVFKKVLT